jgi:hypothetical protein
MQGEGRAVRYRRAEAPSHGSSLQAPPASPLHASSEIRFPVSAAGESIRAYVAQPRQLRRPVGYQLGFLEAYHPNHTAYLPPGLREQLHALGRSPAAQTPAGTFARDQN